MTSSDKVAFGLALTIMEVQRLAQNGFLRIGDRIRRLHSVEDVVEVIDLAPDLGESQEDYLLVKLEDNTFPTPSSFGHDRPQLRLLSRSNVASFHLLRSDAKDLLEDRAHDFGIELFEPLWSNGFDIWRKKTLERVLKGHAERLCREFGLPSPDVACVASIERAMANEVNDAKVTVGTPAYGWAVVFKSVMNEKASKDDSDLKKLVKAALNELRARSFAAAEFFAVDGAEAVALAKKLRHRPDADISVPLEARVWLNQIGHQYFRGEPPTPEAFNRSMTWLAHVTSPDCAASCLEVCCYGSVRLDARQSMAWPTVADLASLTGSIIAQARPDSGSRVTPSELPSRGAPEAKGAPDPSHSDVINDAASKNQTIETQDESSLQDKSTDGAAKGTVFPSVKVTDFGSQPSEIVDKAMLETNFSETKEEVSSRDKSLNGNEHAAIPDSAEEAQRERKTAAD